MDDWGKIKSRRIFETVAELEERINSYFLDCEKEKSQPTVGGLSLHCGFMDRQSLFDYINRDYQDKHKRKFAACIKKAKSFIERNVEDQLQKGEGNQAGRIFVLKNGFNWRDKVEIDQHITGELSLSDVLQQGKQGN